MQKTKLGISVGVLCAILFFTCLFGGWLASFVIAAYILINEENPWLKKTSIKAILLMILFTVIPAVLNLIPELFSVLDSIWYVFDKFIDVDFFNTLERIIRALNSIIYYIESILFLLLGIFALKQSTIKIPGIDALLNKFID